MVLFKCPIFDLDFMVHILWTISNRFSYHFLLKLKTSIERLWTDYERLNQTHFWSETVKVWWTSKNNSQFMNYMYDDEYTYFDDQVVIDGYKKLRNVHATNGASCICIGSCPHENSVHMKILYT